jgi:hypothetical protein
MQIDLPPSTEAMLRQHALASGLDFHSFVINLLQQVELQEVEVSRPSRSHNEWLAEIKHWSNQHPVTNRHADASRESIYEGRGR